MYNYNYSHAFCSILSHDEQNSHVFDHVIQMLDADYYL